MIPWCLIHGVVVNEILCQELVMTTGVAPVTSLEEGRECGLGTVQVVAHHGHPLNDPFLVEVIQHLVLRARLSHMAMVPACQR